MGLEGRGNEANDDEATVVTEQDERENECVRNILRQPRYFDDDYEAAALRCFRCGQGGHREAECTLPRRKRRVTCVDSRRTSRDCPHGLCFNCLTPGHRVELSVPVAGSGRDAQKLCCLRCGKSGHVVAGCVYKFDASDLAQIHCYVCGSFGHLCCAPQDRSLLAPSCCRCGAEGTWTSRARALEEDSAVAVPPNSRVSTAASAVTSLASVEEFLAVRPRNRGGLFEAPQTFAVGSGGASRAGVGEAAADEDTAVDRLPVHREGTPKSTADRGGDRRTRRQWRGGGGRRRLGRRAAAAARRTASTMVVKQM